MDADEDDPAYEPGCLSDLPVTWTATTPSGGHHYYYLSDEPVRSSTRILPGVDVRGEGGLVVAPPASGRAWTFTGGDTPATLPAEWRDKHTQRYAQRSSTAGWYGPPTPELAALWLDLAASAVCDAPEGDRNETLNRETWHVAELCARRQLLDLETVRNEMLDAALRAGLPEHEAARTIDSALRGL